jgi:hypothetical protein
LNADCLTFAVNMADSDAFSLATPLIILSQEMVTSKNCGSPTATAKSTRNK